MRTPFRSFLCLLAIIAFGSCKPEPPPAAAATAAPVQAAPSASTLSLFGAGTCLSLHDWSMKGEREFTFSDNYARASNDDEEGTNSEPFVPYQMHFNARLGAHTRSGQIEFDQGQALLDAVVVDQDDILKAAQVCDGHIFVINLAQERGGSLVIGNLGDAGISITRLPYSSGDEDTAQVAFKDGALVVTDANGSFRLEETLDAEETDDPMYGLVPESIECKQESPQGYVRLWIVPNIDGSVRKFDLLTVMPSKLSCSASAGFDDNAVVRQDKDVTHVEWEGEDYDSQMHILRSGGTYRLETAGYYPPAFCGQSAQLVESVTLQRGQARCVDAIWPAKQ